MENTQEVVKTKPQAVKTDGKKPQPKKEQQTVNSKKNPAAADTVARPQQRGRSQADEQELVNARKTLEETLTPFFKQATINEANSLVEYVNAKMSAKNMEKRYSAAMAIAPKSTHLQSIMETLPIIDSLMIHLSLLPATFAGKNADKFAQANKNLLDTATNLIKISEKLNDFVDMACGHNLVRSKTVMARYAERKALKAEMRSFKIDPEATNANELLKQARTQQKTKTKAQEAEEKAKKKEIDEENLRQKQLKLEQEEQNKQTNELLMERFGVTRAQLTSLKRELKTFEIDVSSKDAVAQLAAKRKEAETLIQDDSKKESA